MKTLWIYEQFKKKDFKTSRDLIRQGLLELLADGRFFLNENKTVPPPGK